MIILMSVSCMTWAFIALAIGKYMFGKNAKFWQIMLVFIIAGPIGWTIVLLIWAYDQADKFSQRKKF